MIPRECKRLAEVDFPIAAVSRHAVREKFIRHGHPSTLHLWWARRPLASSRAVLMALLLPDPCDSHCPKDFKKRARELLPQVSGAVGDDDLALREKLLQFISDFANWDNAAKPGFLKVSRGLVQAAHPDETPLVVDPFSGGGSIPLEALRLGCEAFASDLNPVACLILKVLLEDIPRHGPGLADELRKVGSEIKDAAVKELADLYPADPDGATPIAYLWARTVRCEAPNCGAEIPLMRSLWLCKKTKRKRALRTNIARPKETPPQVEFGIVEPASEKEVAGGTVTRAKASCLCCGAVLPPELVRAQLAAQKGGADVIFDEAGERIGGARMTAVVTLRPNEQGRHYRLPNEADYAAVRRAQERVTEILDEWEQGGKRGLCPVPNEPTPTKDTHRAVGSQLPLYGITTFGDLFTARQKVVLVMFSGQIARVEGQMARPLAIALDRLADGSASLSPWLASGEEIKHVFMRQALGMVWDFGEANYLADVSRTWFSAVVSAAKVIERMPCIDAGQVQPADATKHPLPDQSAGVWFTDPPYYDAIPYSDLSDFFLVWLKRTLPGHPLLRDPFDPDNSLSPKKREAVQCEKVMGANGYPKDKNFYESAMAKAFAEGRRVLREDGVSSVVFAHKTTEGWEALLSGMVRGGWTITGSWPIATEMGARLNAHETASLATSIHLICRPRAEDAAVGDWAEVLRELPQRVADWIERLQEEGIRGADLVFACVGPALEIFSRYPRVETPDGREVELPEYLEKVWEVVGRTALENILGTAEAKARNGLAGALEEDSRLTALFLWTLQSTSGDDIVVNEKDEGGEGSGDKSKGFSLVYDVVRRFAQPLGISLPNWESRIIETRKGVVRLLGVRERSKQLFGEDGMSTAADWIEQDSGLPVQQVLFPDSEPVPRRATRGGRAVIGADAELYTPDATTLDRVHAAMLLQASGRSRALRKFLKAEQERGPDFLRLANALSALYPAAGEEKRLLDAMLLAAPR